MNSCFLENPVQRTDETHGITWNIYTQSIYYSSHLLQTTDKSALQTLPKGMSLFSFKVLGQSPSFAKDGNEQFKCTYYVLTMKIFHLISALTLFLDFLMLERLARSWIFGLLEVVQIGQKCVRFQSPIKHPDSGVATISMTRILVHRDEKFFVSTDKVFQSVELIASGVLTKVQITIASIDVEAGRNQERYHYSLLVGWGVGDEARSRVFLNPFTPLEGFRLPWRPYNRNFAFSV